MTSGDDGARGAGPEVPPELVGLICDVAAGLAEGAGTYLGALERLSADADALDDPPWEAAARLAMLERGVFDLYDELVRLFDDELHPFSAVRAMRRVQWALTALARRPIDRRDLLTPAQLDEVLDAEGARAWSEIVMRESGVTHT